MSSPYDHHSTQKHPTYSAYRKLRILDIHFPDHQTAALLVHNEYANILFQTLRKKKVNLKDDFNPLDPAILRDPKHSELSDDERSTTVASIHHAHIIKALEFIRAPVKYSVARSFFL